MKKVKSVGMLQCWRCHQTIEAGLEMSINQHGVAFHSTCSPDDSVPAPPGFLEF